MKKETSKIIHITQCSKSFWNKILFENISINFHPWDKIGIIGKNWCGKTTFLKLLAGEILSDTWGIWNKNSVAHMPQEIECTHDITVLDYITQDMLWREEYKIYPLMEELNLHINLLQTVKSLSGGEQKKLQLTKILLQDADVLLLDEPTNHLDQASLEILQKRITNHPGIVLFVSHDRHFLNMMANKILEMEKEEFTVYHGNYEIYKEEKEKRKMKQQQEYIIYTKEKEKRETRMTEMRQRASVYINPALGRLIKSKEKYIEREIYAHEIEKITKEKSLKLQATWWTHRGKLILEMQKINVGYDDTILIKDCCLEIRGKDKAIITGENGSWKTTLLKHLIKVLQKEIVDENVRVWNDISYEYFDQHNEILQSHEKVLSRFSKNNKTKIPETNIIAQLRMIGLSMQEINMTIDTLSYGQKVKLKFLQMVSAPTNILILDEPTNHLDIPTRETIENMLQEYPWAIVFVSHDQYFANKIHINTTYTIQDRKIITTHHLSL